MEKIASAMMPTASTLHMPELPLRGFASSPAPSASGQFPGAASRVAPSPVRRDLDERNRVVGDVAHDLRGLLAVVKGYAELMREQAADRGETMDETFCRKILRACTLMSDLVENCLDLSRIEAGHLQLAWRQLNLASFIEESVAGHAFRARAKEITLEVCFETALPLLWSDPLCLERILANLIGNAIKFSPPRSTVRIAARVIGGWVEVEVQDQGPGLAIEDAPALFEAYHRGEARPTGGEKTTGLGLAIVKQLVAAHGGQIRVCSSPGAGASFCVSLPANENLLRLST